MIHLNESLVSQQRKLKPLEMLSSKEDDDDSEISDKENQPLEERGSASGSQRQKGSSQIIEFFKNKKRDSYESQG